MQPAAILAFLLVSVLAAVNGSNDVPKGVATLAGAGVTKYRVAILWGTFTTLAGCLCSVALASKMTNLFSSGVVTAKPTTAFALAVLIGAAGWVGLATVLRLPVSTTHALIGGLLGAGVLFAPSSVAWNSIPNRVVAPLLISIGVAYAISVVLALCFGRRRVSDVGTTAPTAPRPTTRGRAVLLSTRRASAVDKQAPSRVLTVAHWATSGATGFARGLNDTPKIVAIGAFTLVPAGMTTWQIMLVVAISMAAGSLLGGMRVAERLGKGVVQMNHREGFLANLTTAVLVGMGASYGLPMSTTHVSTGAIAGSAGPNLSRLSGKTLRDFLIAWLVTPIFAAAVAALVFIIAR